ncbi:MAG TPA: polysaccharide biosynthesis/export family protein, partial [Verrucomicrobiae bacterium]|nr:polysaccharide biosynthesis/export family protein [Verrucomicrobiae bacterium]
MKDTKSRNGKVSPALLVCVLMLVILGTLFWKCFLPDYVHFSNDGPLGMQSTALLKAPQSFFGQWMDLYSLGWGSGASFVDADSLLRWVISPVGYAKFYIPIAQFLLGFGAYFFFRRSGMGPMASILGGLAACLTTNYFSDGAWGAAPAVVAFGMDFLALGALAKRDTALPFWVAPALAGLAVGFNIMEAADIGCLFSLLVAAYFVYRSFADTDPLTIERVFYTFAKGSILTIFAFFMAAYAIIGLVGTNVKGISGTQQDVQTKAMKWDFATQWSLPKRETLSLIVPGLFGDRVDYSDERAYWGGMGRDAAWDRFYNDELKPGDTVDIAMPPDGQVARVQISNNGDIALPSIAPIKAAGMTRSDLQNSLSASPLKGAQIEYGQGFMRHTGRGFYFGLLVVILGLWAAFQSFRKNDSVFSLFERRMIWFWSVVAVISLLAAHGKFSPFKGFYYYIYTHVWGLSTVRSPEKFLHVMNMSMIILFGYGVHGLNRRYLSVAFSELPLGVRLKNWWGKASAFDKRWVVGSALAIVVAFAGWLTYAAVRPAVEKYLTEVQFGPNLAHEITGFSLTQVAWFVVFLTLNCGLLLLIFSGLFAGRRAAWGGVLLGVLLVWDLGRANMHFINPWK